MANFIEKTLINARRFVPFSSRYANSEVVYYTERKLLTFSIYKKKLGQLTPNDKFSVVLKQYEFRPDLLSQDAYGTPDFWWRILESNDIKDVFEFKAGITVRIPDAIL